MSTVAAFGAIMTSSTPGAVGFLVIAGSGGGRYPPREVIGLQSDRGFRSRYQRVRNLRTFWIWSV